MDDDLDELQPLLAAVAIHGPKAVGKTATASRRAHSVLSLDRPTDRELLEADPQRIDRLPAPVLIDEWQRFPPVWDLVRCSVDRGAERGRFLLTGSSAPAGMPLHSGAGRIVGLRMRPLGLAERQIEQPTVSLADLLNGAAHAVDGRTDVDVVRYTEEIVASGFPAIRAEPARIRRARLDAYLDAVIQREMPEAGRLVRKPATLRAWLTAYAAATSSTASYTAILDAAAPGESDKPSRATTLAYRDVLAQLWLLDPVDAWVPARSAFSRLARAPKHQLADPAPARSRRAGTAGRHPWQGTIPAGRRAARRALRTPGHPQRAGLRPAGRGQGLPRSDGRRRPVGDIRNSHRYAEF